MSCWQTKRRSSQAPTQSPDILRQQRSGQKPCDPLPSWQLPRGSPNDFSAFRSLGSHFSSKLLHFLFKLSMLFGIIGQFDDHAVNLTHGHVPAGVSVACCCCCVVVQRAARRETNKMFPLCLAEMTSCFWPWHFRLCHGSVLPACSNFPVISALFAHCCVFLAQPCRPSEQNACKIPRSWRHTVPPGLSEHLSQLTCLVMLREQVETR